MRTRNKFQEDHGVNRHISTSGGSDNGPEDTECCKIAQASDGSAKQSSDDQSGIESRLSPDQISTRAPEESAKDQASIVGDGTECDVRYTRELERHGWLDGADAL